jgi:hypothetical protein
MVRVERAKILQNRMSSYVAIGHTLKNVISSTGWSTASREVAMVRRNFAEMQKRGLTR